MFWLNILYKIFKVLKDGATPKQIAGGLTFGFIVGFTPGWPLHLFLLLLVIFLLNVNLSMVAVASALSVFISWLFDPLIHKTGLYLLQQIPALHDFYTFLYNNPFWMLTRFNNTIVMGSFVISLVLAIPLFFIFRVLIIFLRKSVFPKLANTKIAKLFKKSWIYGIYSKIDAVGSKL